MTAERPYLVLTLRRTGGTSLMACMTRVSSFRGSEHEPLNGNRSWGHITSAFRDNRDEAAMNAALAQVLASRPNVKHCFEIIPQPVTRALVRQCAALGYGIFTLTRRDEVARQRSLALAKLTGVWGPKQADKVYPEILAGRKTLAPVDLTALKRQYLHDLAWTRDLLDFLETEQIGHERIVFEDLYARDGRITERVSALLRHLGIAMDPDDARLAGFATSEGQNSAALLEHLPNARAFADALDALREG